MGVMLIFFGDGSSMGVRDIGLSGCDTTVGCSTSVFKATSSKVTKIHAKLKSTTFTITKEN
jgi:hypothetical protein